MAYTPAVGDMPAFTAEEIANAKAYFNQVGSLDQVIQEATAAGYTPEQVASLYAQSMPEQGVSYNQALSVFNEQAAKIPTTNPLQEFVANNAPTDEQINESNRLRFGTADEVGFQDVVNNMGSVNTGTMLTKSESDKVATELPNAKNQTTMFAQGTEFSPEFLSASKLFFEEMNRRQAAGEDMSGLIDARRQELGLTYNQLANLFTQSMGTDPSVANNVVNDYLGAQGKAPINFYSQQPLTQASPGVVPTLRPQPVQGVDNQVYLSPEQKSGIKEYFTEIGRLAETGVDIGPIVDKRRQELGLSYNQLADAYTQSMGTDPSFIRTGINQYLTGQGQQPVDFAKESAQGMMRSTGFQSPVPSDISSLFSAVQGVRDINQGYLSAPRTDLSQLRSDLEAQYATQAQAAQQQQAMLEAEKKNMNLGGLK